MAYSSAVVVTPVDMSADGINTTTLPTTPTATHGNKVVNDNRTYVEVHNGSASEITVTVDIPVVVEGQAVPDRAVAVPAGQRRRIGPFSNNYNQADGYVWLICSAVTTVTLGAFRMPKV